MDVRSQEIDGRITFKRRGTESKGRNEPKKQHGRMSDNGEKHCRLSDTAWGFNTMVQQHKIHKNKLYTYPDINILTQPSRSAVIHSSFATLQPYSKMV
jgi:hypothetical protein